MTEVTDPNPVARRRPLEEVAPGVFIAGLQGNSLIADTGDGLVLVDTGPDPALVPALLAEVREHTRAPIRWIVYSHGHLGYNFGLPAFIEDARRRGDARPTVIAHENVVRRYRRYRETAGLQNLLRAAQFRMPPDSYPAELPLAFPEVTYRDAFTIGGPTRSVQLLWAPSETDDVTAVWLPEDRILYGSAAVIPSIPNIGTPLRTMRDAVRWADTLDRLAALDAEVLIPEFRGPQRENIEERLTTTARALRWLRAEVVARLNRGMSADRIIHDLDYPDELFDKPWMTEAYGHREYIVRDIVRSETGWWDGNPTTLHPCPPDVAGELIADAITDKQSVLDKARALRDAGRLQEALHVVDLLAEAAGSHPAIAAARKLKGEICVLRSAEATSYVSRSLYQVESGNRLFR